jgi:hypothetical protein
MSICNNNECSNTLFGYRQKIEKLRDEKTDLINKTEADGREIRLFHSWSNHIQAWINWQIGETTNKDKYFRKLIKIQFIIILFILFINFLYLIK